MDFGSLFWFFFLIASLQPVIRQRMLDTARLHILDRLERRRKSRVIAQIHRQETLSLLGFPLVRYINIEDSEAVLRAIKMTDKDVPIDIILHTPGGLGSLPSRSPAPSKSIRPRSPSSCHIMRCPAAPSSPWPPAKL